VATINMFVGDSITLDTAQLGSDAVRRPFATKPLWLSSNAAVATPYEVSPGGDNAKIKALSIGTSTLTVGPTGDTTTIIINVTAPLDKTDPSTAGFTDNPALQRENQGGPRFA
jgi:hypothetical protein